MLTQNVSLGDAHRMWLTLAMVVIAGCDAAPPREAALVAAFVDAEELSIRARPELVAGKYARMARSLYDFYRGSVPLYRADFRDPSIGIGSTNFPASVLPFSTGDQHPENFGLLEAQDGSLSLEPNDLDSADRYPYHWDLRRLNVGLVLLCRLANAADEEAQRASAATAPAVVSAATRAYAEAIARYADHAPLDRVEDDRMVPAIADLFRRGLRDQAARAELVEQTIVEGGARRLRRGVLDSDDPEEAFHELPAWVRPHLREMLERYRGTLFDPPMPEFFTVLDAVRVVGRGVASWPRVRLVVLVAGDTDAQDDDVLIEIKEANDSGAEGWIPPGSYADDVPGRIRQATQWVWARPHTERLWSATTWLGIPIQIRLEAESQKVLRVDRQEGNRGTPEALIALGRELGMMLARVHAAPAPGADGCARAITEAIGRDPMRFVEGEVEVALAYADRVETDFEHFKDALLRLGPTLGVPVDVRDRARDDLRALFDAPEPVRSWE